MRSAPRNDQIQRLLDLLLRFAHALLCLLVVYLAVRFVNPLLSPVLWPTLFHTLLAILAK